MIHIGAGIVTYNPKISRLSDNIKKLKEQVSSIIIVDNGSDNIDSIQDAVNNLSCVKIIKNSSNLGVGAALNQIINGLSEQKIDWALLMDQDSIIADNLIKEYKKYISDKVGLLSPYIIDINKITLEEYNSIRKKLSPISVIQFAITSGSMININVFNKIGGFDESLFIDGIDTDYSKRLTINDYKQYRVNRTYILHEVGKAEPTHFFRVHKDNAGKLSFRRYYRTNHSPQRIYYMARNNIIITKRYKKYYSTIKGYTFLIRYMLAKALFEKNKKEVLKHIFKGIKDGIAYPEKGYKI